jgi:PAS domain S-box-containing protein
MVPAPCPPDAVVTDGHSDSFRRPPDLSTAGFAATQRTAQLHPQPQHDGHGSAAGMPDLLATRAKYLAEGGLPEGVRPVVLDAWRRCRDYGVDPEHMRPQQVDPVQLARARAANHALLTAAEPLLQRVHLLLGENNPHVIALCDREGCVLRLLTTTALAQDPATQAANLFEGASWHERDIGCNGAGTSLAAGKPLVLIGPEHFLAPYVDWTCVGVPLRSPGGEMIGALDVSAPNVYIRTDLWGWVLTLGREIEASLARDSTDAAPAPIPALDSELSALTGVTELLVCQLNLPPTHQRFIDDVARAAAASVAERRRTDAALRESEQRYRQLFDANPHPMWVYDRETLRFLAVNDAAIIHYGYSREEFLQMTLADIRPAEDVPQMQESVRSMAPGYAEVGGRRHRKKNGSIMDVEIATHTLPFGGHDAVLVLARDVTRQKRAEEALRASESFHRQTLESIPGMVFTKTPDGRCDYVSRQWVEFTGVPAEQQLGSGWLEVLHPEDGGRAHAAWQAAVAGRGDFDLEYRVRRHDGAFEWFKVRGRAIRDAAGNVARWFGTAVNVQDLKQAEAAVARVQEQLRHHAAGLEYMVAERTTKLRETISELEHFSYTIAHDMRAPLRAMQAFAAIIREEYQDRLDDVGRDYLRRITAAADRMDSLITDALSYSKAVQTELMLEPMEPGSLIREIVETYPQFHERGAQIEIHGAFPAVLANKAGLTQCVSNLLDNAVKFVSPGTVPTVRIWAEQRGAFIRLWFEDNGIGIGPEQRERVFGMFQKLNRSFPGTGIGLALVRKVAQRMQGEVGVESQPGVGSRFWLELRQARAGR